MTDKEQIMIDGVDVSECRSFDKESYTLGVYDCDLNELHGYCYCNNDCHFKQLARKTQEYNDLLEQHKELDDRVNRMIEEKYNLARECEELKEKVKAYEKLALHITCPHCNKELGLILDGSEENINTFNRYRNALEEIEKIIKEYDCVNCTKQHCIDCNKYEIFYTINKAKEKERNDKNHTIESLGGVLIFHLRNLLQKAGGRFGREGKNADTGKNKQRGKNER